MRCDNDRQHAHKPIAEVGKAAQPSFIGLQPVAQEGVNPARQQGRQLLGCLPGQLIPCGKVRDESIKVADRLCPPVALLDKGQVFRNARLLGFLAVCTSMHHTAFKLDRTSDLIVEFVR